MACTLNDSSTFVHGYTIAYTVITNNTSHSTAIVATHAYLSLPTNVRVLLRWVQIQIRADTFTGYEYKLVHVVSA